MKKTKATFRPVLAALLAAALILPAAAQAQETDLITVNPTSGPMTAEEVRRMTEDAAEAFYDNGDLRDELESEITQRSEVVPTMNYQTEEREFYILTHNGNSMRFFMEIIGEPDENGRYPLYITLHGGGGGPKEGNNDEWITMSYYYRTSVENGIYVACRGITDTWDLHFREESYPLYDRLIEAMIVLHGADPNRVYLLGFSAGGDGVYQVSPRLADRFAAVNMSSGHPNSVSLLNLANCPICLQAGVRDWYDEDAMRSVRAAEFDETLSGYREKYGFGYEHRVFIHVPAGHNYEDYKDTDALVLSSPALFAERAEDSDALGVFLEVMEECGIERDVSELSYYPCGDSEVFDIGITEAVTDTLGLETETANTNAVGYVSQFTRDPAPARLVWDLSTRANTREKNGFYWLEADPSVDRGVITAEYDHDSNTITVEPDEEVNGDFAILFNPSLVDVSRPVVIRTGDIERVVRVNPSEEILRDSMLENGDPALGCVGKIMYSDIASAGR